MSDAPVFSSPAANLAALREDPLESSASGYSALASPQPRNLQSEVRHVQQERQELQQRLLELEEEERRLGDMPEPSAMGPTPRVSGAARPLIRLDNGASFSPLTKADLRSRHASRALRLRAAIEKLLAAREEGCEITLLSVFDAEARECLASWWGDEQAEDLGPVVRTPLHLWWSRPDISGASLIPTEWTGCQPRQVESFVQWVWQNKYPLLAAETTTTPRSGMSLFTGVKMQWRDVRSQESVDVFFDAVQLIVQNASETLLVMTEQQKREMVRLLVVEGIQASTIAGGEFVAGGELVVPTNMDIFTYLRRKSYLFVAAAVKWAKDATRFGMDEELSRSAAAHARGGQHLEAPLDSANQNLSRPGLIRKRVFTAHDAQVDTKRTKVLCTGCGRSHTGGAAACFLHDHPDFNRESVPWAVSEAGRRLARAGLHDTKESHIAQPLK